MPRGPHLVALDAAAAAARSLETSATLRQPGGAVLEVQCQVPEQRPPAGYAYATTRSPRHVERAPQVSDALLHMAAHVGGGWTLDADSITARGSHAPVKGKALRDLCVAAWHEAFDQEAPRAEARAEKRKQAQASQGGLLDLLTAGRVQDWNARVAEAEAAAPFSRVDLQGRDLSGVRLVDMPGARLQGARLGKADLSDRDLSKASFAGADLTGANLHRTNLKGADLTGANLTETDLRQARLQGALLTGARLEGVRWIDWIDAQFDGTTVWPAGFAVPEVLAWTGKGPNPAALAAIAARKAQEGPLDQKAFMARIEKTIEKERLRKALSMLKHERFQLFTDVTPARLTGVVKSQSDPDLVYCSALGSDGSFSCCTQNLNVCGGLRGALCKHLLLLVVGMAQAGEIDPDTLDDWVQRSGLQKPVLDREAATAVFLRYKGAEAGQIDWRPTETVPEDFYAY